MSGVSLTSESDHEVANYLELLEAVEEPIVEGTTILRCNVMVEKDGIHELILLLQMQSQMY